MKKAVAVLMTIVVVCTAASCSRSGKKNRDEASTNMTEQTIVEVTQFWQHLEGEDFSEAESKQPSTDVIRATLVLKTTDAETTTAATTTRPTTTRPTTTTTTRPTTTTTTRPTTTTTTPRPTTTGQSPTSCAHEWIDATCTSPRMCRKCGMTQGSANGHNYAPATCTRPKTCRNCGVTTGSAIGHDYDASGVCRRCGAVDPNATTAKPTRTAEEFYKLLASDTWVTLCDRVTDCKHYTFGTNGEMKVRLFANGQDTTLTYSDPMTSGSDVMYREGGETVYKFLDLGSDDMIHCISDGVCTMHSVLIRRSKVNSNTALTDRLGGTQWRSPYLARNGVNSIRVYDCVVVSANENTAYLVYRPKVGDDIISAVVQATGNPNRLNAYLMTTYAAEDGHAPEMTWHPEQWTIA